MPNYVPTIGLEIHVELKTKTKMFCDCLNNPDEKHPNVNVCPVCLAHPGALPTMNKEAIRSVIKVGLALGGEINPESKFDRKNYFYPDLPKGYQISQYDKPLVLGGSLNGITLRRVHLEEDTGRLVHLNNDSQSISQDSSFVDFNRAGVPLMELVTEPEIKSAEEAMNFAKEFQLILRYLGVSDADMEKGQLRVEVNISLGKWFKGIWKQGTKVEIKNLNSFRVVGEAAAYEIKRQAEVMGHSKVKQETRGWDDLKKETFSQRSKEEAHDYRYFPEPDLPPFETESFDIPGLRASLPELPKDKRERFKKEFNLDNDKAEILVADPAISNFFEAAVSELKAISPGASFQNLFNYLTSDLIGLTNEAGISFSEIKISPEELAHLAALIEQGKILSRGAKDILRAMFETGEDPEVILESKNLHIISDENEIKKIITEVIGENEKAVADYRAGKETSIQFLIGKAMSKLKGRGNPENLKILFAEALK